MPNGRRWWKKLICRDLNCQVDKVCDVCNEAMHSKRLKRPHWGQTVCYKHSSDGTPMCCSCLRFKLGKTNTGYISLSDGRKLCSECHSTSIMDTESCIPLFQEVHKFFEGLNMKIVQDIPILLVDKHEINKLSNKFGGQDELGNPMGMATYTAGFFVESVARSSQRGKNIHVVKKVHCIQSNHEVTSLLLVYGFPRLAIGATLAHEMMHAWMHIEGYKGLRTEVEEGLCEVMAHRWLDWYAFVGDDFLHATPEQAQFLRNLKEVLQNNIERNDCKIYGGGYRDAKWAIERYGLKYTMSHVAQTGKFPR